MTTFKNQSYLYIKLKAGIDLTTATTTKIVYMKPSGAAGTWNADVVDSIWLYHDFADGEQDENGTWKAQTYAVIDGRKIWGDIMHFKVQTPLLATVS